jgi:hypothetical protein
MGVFDEASANLTKSVLHATAQLSKNNNIALFMQQLQAAFGTVSTATIGGAQFGGQIPAMRPTLVGEAGPEIYFPSQRGYVMDNADSVRLINALERIAAGAGSIRSGNAFNLTVNTPSSANIVRDFAMLQAIAGS